MLLSKYHNKVRSVRIVLVAFSAQSRAAGAVYTAVFEVAANTLCMEGILLIQPAVRAMAGAAFNMGIAGIQFCRIQDIIVLLVKNMVTIQAVILSHVHIMGKCHRKALTGAGLSVHRAGIQHGKGKNTAKYEQHKHYAKHCFFW